MVDGPSLPDPAPPRRRRRPQIPRLDRVPVSANPDSHRGEEVPTALPVDQLWDDVLRLYGSGLHPAIALNIRHKGEVVLDRTVGHRVPGGDQPVTPDTLFNLFSASKILTASVVHALVERGVLSLEERVADTIPALGRHGKHTILLRHLLHHTAGIPDMPQGLDPMGALADLSASMDELCRVPSRSPPGATVAYHPISSWVLLAELLQRRTGHDLRTLSRELLLDPLGLDQVGYGVSSDRLDDVALHAYTGARNVPVMRDIFIRTVGVTPRKAVELSNSPAFLQGILPSANVVSTPRQITRFMQMLLEGGSLGGVRVLSEDTVERMLGWETPRSFDGTFGFPVRYGLGLMKGGRRFSLFGRDMRHAFGHLGFSNILVYADPDRQLSVAFLNTGKPLLAPGMVPWMFLVQKIATAVPKTRQRLRR